MYGALKIEIKKILNIQVNVLQLVFFAILGLIGGVFYRKFSKVFNYSELTSLNFLHLHLLVLGFIYLILYSICKKDDITKLKYSLIISNIGLGWTITSFMVRGIFTITSNGYTPFKDALLSGITGVGHMILEVGLIITLLLLLINIINKEEVNNIE